MITSSESQTERSSQRDAQPREEKADLLWALRSRFPILETEHLAYLDNAATTQKPRDVLDEVREYYERENANPFRGVYDLSERATFEYEESRRVVSRFIGAESESEIVFTRNATESLNLVAYSYAQANLKPGDEVVVSILEHHSNFLPWKAVCERTGARLVRLDCTLEGTLPDEELGRVITERTKLVALTHVSNVLGCRTDLKRIAELAHSRGAVLVADGAQSVPHIPVDVRDLDVDFLAFSGHKMYAPMGIGVLYGKRALLEAMPPFLSGGEMIETVHWDKVHYAEVPHKFEAGTVNVGGAVGLRRAIESLEQIGFGWIGERERKLTRLAMERMRSIDGVHILGSQSAEDHLGIVAFTVDGVHPHDVADILGHEGICIRAGHHCAQPLMDHLGVRSTSRVSFGLYNTEEEVERFAEALGRVRGLMGY